MSSIPRFPHDHWSLWHCSIEHNNFGSPLLPCAGFLIAILLTRKDCNQRIQNFQFRHFIFERRFLYRALFKSFASFLYFWVNSSLFESLQITFLRYGHWTERGNTTKGIHPSLTKITTNQQDCRVHGFLWRFRNHASIAICGNWTSHLVQTSMYQTFAINMLKINLQNLVPGNQPRVITKIIKKGFKNLSLFHTDCDLPA